MPKEKPKCIYCGSNEHQEMWGESGEFWWHCHQCDKDSDENIDDSYFEGDTEDG